MREYIVLEKEEKESINWDKIESLRIEDFPWFVSGEKQGTEVKVVKCGYNLLLKVQCEDSHISSSVTEINGQVCNDSCFEFFFTPEDELGGKYFNLEINCCGCILMSYRERKGMKNYCTKEQADRIDIESTVKSSTKEVDHADNGWGLQVKIPVDLLEEMKGEKIHFDTWYGNFYRCGGAVDPQYGVWNHIEWDKPNYHLPEQFGKIIFK